MPYKFALQDNPDYKESSNYSTDKRTEDSHGKSVILVGKFPDAKAVNASEVVRLTFGTNSIKVKHVYGQKGSQHSSLQWNNILLGVFTDHWFSVVYGSPNKSLQYDDLQSLAQRFLNTMQFRLGRDWLGSVSYMTIILTFNNC